MKRAARRDWRAPRSAWLWILPIAALFAVFILYPILRNVQVSFYRWDGLTQDKVFIGLRNYRWFFTDRGSLLSLRNVLLYGVLTTALQMGLGFLFAICLRGNGLVRAATRTVIFLPLILTPVAVGYLFAEILEPSHGILNQALRGAGLGRFAASWLGDPGLALIVVAVVNIWMWTGFAMAIYHAALDGVPREVIEAATIEGATLAQVVQHVYLPMLRPTHYSLLVLNIIGSLKTFDLIYVLTRGGPAHATEMPATYLYSTAFGSFQQGRAATIGTVLLVLALVLTIAQLRLQKRGER
jgi:raffinose/stachyose/melibiose transport system permease protein